MAKFRGTVQGDKGEASRLGHNTMKTTCNSWNKGVEVIAKFNKDDKEEFHIYITGGSNRKVPNKLLEVIKT